MVLPLAVEGAPVRPDYATLRDTVGLTWSVEATYLALLEISGIGLREFNLDPGAGVEAYRKGRRLLSDLYGPDLALPGPATPPISYGHINALGVPLVFPEGGEVNYERCVHSMAGWCDVLSRPVDFASAGRIGHFLDYKARMERAFPAEKVGLSWGHEGPLTTAYELLDFAAFTAPYDDPAGFTRFLDLQTESIVAFIRFSRRLRGDPEMNPGSGFMCDDCASMYGPALWPRFVLPHWEQFFRGITRGKRGAHVEDLRREQLPFLEEIGLWSYDPSISHKLNPRLIRDGCRVPYGWRLANFHYPGMSEQDIRDWVFQAVADGASSVYTYVCAMMTTAEAVRKVRAFIEAAQEAARMLGAGASRSTVGSNVSAEGRTRFWASWP